MLEDDDETYKAEADNDFGIEQPEVKQWSRQAAFYILDVLNIFCRKLGDADLVRTLNLATRRLETLRSFAKKGTDYFNKTL